MKTTKKIFAALLAVMMIVMMIPVTASAATTTSTYSVNITGHSDFTFTLYKVADFNVTEGTYSNFAAGAGAVKTALTTDVNGKLDSAALLTACNALSDADLSGREVDTFSASYSNSNLAAGAYYVKATQMPATYTKVGNSVFAVPYISADGSLVTDVTVNAGTKCANGEVTFNKYFTDYPNDAYIAAGLGDEVKFTIEASTAGSTEAKLQSYKIVDTMSKGLTFNDDVTVTLTDGKNGEADLALSDSQFAVTVTGTNSDFEVALDESVLKGTDFYSYSTVKVEYTATVNRDAVIAGKGNTNDAQLQYKNAAGKDATVDDEELTVYTFKIDVDKVDAADTSNKLADAEFTLYSDENCTKVVGTTTTDANGKGTFERLKPGTYYLKETKAPEGYVLNPNAVKVVVSYTVATDKTATPTLTVDGAAVSAVQVKNTRILVPQTGGMGTIMFTIGGATLIALAGVLFLVVRRKKSAQ